MLLGLTLQEPLSPVTLAIPLVKKIEDSSGTYPHATTGTIVCSAKLTHCGKSTQVWDVVVSHKETGKTIALFRCTQMILYAK